MSTWWDDDKKKHRSTLVYKLFYVWTWSITQFCMFKILKPEQAHWFAIHVAIRFVSFIDKIWCWCFVFPATIVFILFIRVLLFIPGFYIKKPDEKAKREFK